MTAFKLWFTYSARLVLRQWRYFTLSFLSLLVTAVVMQLILLLTTSSSILLSEQARALLGGDITIETTSLLDVRPLLNEAGLEYTTASTQLEFNATLESNSATAPFSLRAVDAAFPLYGEFGLRSGSYRHPAEGDIFIDSQGAERLGVSEGDSVRFGEAVFTVAGVIVTEPNSLLSGFRFFPRAIISDAGFLRAGLDPALLRVEYETAFVVPGGVNSEARERLLSLQAETNRAVAIRIAGDERGGLQFGLSTVTQFLIVAVLITAVLAAVNVYASTLYLVTLERKSFAVLVSLGMRNRSLIAILALALFYVVLFSSVIGAVFGSGLFLWLSTYVASQYLVELPLPNLWQLGFICSGLVAATAYGSFAPAVRKSLTLSPRQLLLGESEESGRLKGETLIIITGVTLLPLFALASYLLESIYEGVFIMLAILLAYVAVAILFFIFLDSIYRIRHKFSFTWRSIIAHKKADGLFGIVSFTSLFAALTALSTLTLVENSLERYLSQDLSRTLPTTYVIDVQPSQRLDLADNFPDLNLFASIPARLNEIDGVMIQEEIASGSGRVDREFGREFNLTGRAELLDSERIVRGMWGEGKPGEISVDESFATRANIRLGSTITFSIQGFLVSGVVTSLRETDSRSGLPFFYFVLSPEDVGDFPSVYFGYAYFDEVEQASLGRYVAANMPNVTVLETQALGPLVIQIIETMLLLVFVVTIPPLLIATLLIVTLVISSYASRRREGGRLRALGATREQVWWQYIIESVFLTALAAVLAYLVSVLIALLITEVFLKLGSPILFSFDLLTGLYLIVALVAAVSWYLFKRDQMPLRELLSYEDIR